MLQQAMADYLRTQDGPARIPDIRAAAEKSLGRKIAQSSVRSGLQNEEFFQRVSRGVFQLRPRA